RRTLRHLRRGRLGEPEQRVGVRVERPVPVFLLQLEGGTDDARCSIVDERLERPELRDLANNAIRGDVSAHEDRLRAGRAGSPARAAPPARGPATGGAPALRIPREPPVTKTEEPSKFTSGTDPAGV